MTGVSAYGSWQSSGRAPSREPRVPSRSYPACRSLPRLPAHEIVQVGHMGNETVAGSVLRVSGHELIVVLRGREVERIARVVVHQHQVGVAHRELAESKRAAAIVHVVGK